MPFSRHIKSRGGFGVNLLRKAWRRAAEKVGLFGVSLYPGTKHTTATETAQLLCKQAALEASGLTNKAFERYCQAEKDSAFETVTALREQMTGKVIKLDIKKDFEQV